jgi:hypothetical protein
LVGDASPGRGGLPAPKGLGVRAAAREAASLNDFADALREFLRLPPLVRTHGERQPYETVEQRDARRFYVAPYSWPEFRP